MALYHSLSLDKGLTAQAASPSPGTTPCTCSITFSPPKPRRRPAYLTTLGYSLNAAGEVDPGGPGEREMNCPLVASGRLAERHPFLRTTVTPGRKDVHLAAIIRPTRGSTGTRPCGPCGVSSDRVVGVIQEPRPPHPFRVGQTRADHPIESACRHAPSDPCAGGYRPPSASGRTGGSGCRGCPQRRFQTDAARSGPDGPRLLSGRRARRLRRTRTPSPSCPTDGSIASHGLPTIWEAGDPVGTPPALTERSPQRLPSASCPVL